MDKNSQIQFTNSADSEKINDCFSAVTKQVVTDSTIQSIVLYISFLSKYRHRDAE